MPGKIPAHTQIHTQIQTTTRYAHIANDSMEGSDPRVNNSIGLHITPFEPS